MAVEQLPCIRVPEEGTGQRERMERAEAEVCPTNGFPTLMLRPGLETRETRGTRRFSTSHPHNPAQIIDGDQYSGTPTASLAMTVFPGTFSVNRRAGGIEGLLG